MSENVIVYTDGRVFHAWDPASTARDHYTKCGRQLRLDTFAHHWGPRSMFASYYTPCRRCYRQEADDE